MSNPESFQDMKSERPIVIILLVLLGFVLAMFLGLVGWTIAGAQGPVPIATIQQQPNVSWLLDAPVPNFDKENGPKSVGQVLKEHEQRLQKLETQNASTVVAAPAK